MTLETLPSSELVYSMVSLNKDVAGAMTANLNV